MSPTPFSSDRGSASVELAVVMATFVLTFLMLVLYAGRVAEAENAATSAAQAGARAATLELDFGSAQKVGSSVAKADLGDAEANCLGASTNVSLHTPSPSAAGGWGPGAIVQVVVVCTPAKSFLSELGITTTKPHRAVAHEIVDVFRSEP